MSVCQCELSNVQERQVGKKGGEENVGYEANEAGIDESHKK